MLYDPKWEVQAKPDALSLESLIAWLETMPADMTYDWHSCEGECLIGLYLRAAGFEPHCASRYLRFQNMEIRYFVAATEPRTFGAALSRARKALAA